MEHRIVVTSSKGGVGKSTTAAMTAFALAERGKKVLLIDLDLGARCLDMFFGIENETVCDFGTAYADISSASRSVRRLNTDDAGSIMFCASSVSLTPEKADRDRLIATIDALAEEAGADTVICDTSGLLIPEKLAKWADLGLVCTTQMPAAVTSAGTTAGRLREAGLDGLRLVITAFQYYEAHHSMRAGLLRMIDTAGIQAIGVVPQDLEMFLLQEEGKLPGRSSDARRAYANIAARLCGEERRLFDGIRGMNGKSVL